MNPKTIEWLARLIVLFFALGTVFFCCTQYILTIGAK